jgi:Domain of unknown function (DUF222)
MTPGPAPGPGRDAIPARRTRGPGDPLADAAAGWRRLPPGPDWMDEEQWAARPVGEEPPDPDRYFDPEDPPLPGEVDLDALIAGAREITADQARAAALAAAAGTTGALAAAAARAAGRRGPGMPGSECLPGEYPGPAGGFASGLGLDTMPGGLVLMSCADDAAGADDTYPGASDDELVGVICAWDRVQSHAAARKHAAAAELIRRRPAPGCVLAGPARMPAGWQEFTGDELAPALAQSVWAAAAVLELAWELAVKLPGTAAAFRSGVLQENKARIIAAATQLLDPGEARAAEALVLDRAGTLTPGGLRAAIARAVMAVAPDKARKRREEAAKDARVERWAEDSGNAALAGRELPPAEVLAADQRINWWAGQLRTAGLEGSMDELRARAYLDLLLGMDSRPAAPLAAGNGAADSPGPDGPDSPDGSTAPDDRGPEAPDGTDGDDPDGDDPDGDDPDGDDPDGGGPGGGGSGPPGPGGPAPAGPAAGVIPPGFAGRVNLTVPLATALGLADRPGEAAGIGPVDPWLARDLAAAAARNPATTWCLTVTDRHGRPIGHGCARPAPAASPAKRARPGARAGPGPPPADPKPGFTIGREHGPPGGYGTWRLSTPIPGARDLIIDVEPIGTDPCDHRRQAHGHDPGVMLRHLAEVRYATCTGPSCRRPATQSDFEHNTPYQAGGRTCLCNGDPKCRHDHRVKQDPRWHVDQLPDGTIRWTTPAGRQYTKEPTRYPI